jgi:glycine/D-amino acid oxidase-like deaminating enzyme
MPRSAAEVVICGAGIAGISLAHELARVHRMRDIVLVDERPPMTLTSDKSSEAYRNWWPGPDDAMIRLLNRAIDRLEDLARSTDNRFLMNRRGYLWCTADPIQAEDYREHGLKAAAEGAGELRIHTGRMSDPDYRPHRAEGWEDQPDGADLILEDMLLRQAFPYLGQDVYAALHTRRCGWLSGQQLGMELLERARAAGVELIEGRVEKVETAGGRVTGVKLSGRSGNLSIPTSRFVDAAGPMLGSVAQLLDLELPVHSELHLKTSFEDHLGVVPRDLPFLIWDDPQRLAWSPEEREELARTEETAWLLKTLPAGAHMRPEGKKHVLLLWPYHAEETPETFPLEIPEEYTELCLRGLAAVLPGLEAYLGRLPRPYVDGGYYTKTRENRPLACPLPVEGAFVHGALSGFGLMAAMGTAEVVAAQITGSRQPVYAPAFDLARYEDPAYLARLEDWGDDGQL